MPKLLTLLQGRSLQLYLLGLVSIFAGAWVMSVTRSMVPMAMASSLGLMLAAPLLRHLLRRARTSRRGSRP